MIDLIAQHRIQIEQLCQRYGVKRLELFGSAARGDFDPTRSDVDFFIEFASYEDPDIDDKWFGLQEDLEKLLGQRVELTSLRMATNPHFLQSANEHKVTLYAA